MTYIQRLVTQRDMTKYLKNEIKLKKHVTFNLLDVVSNLQVLAIRADAMYLFFLNYYCHSQFVSSAIRLMALEENGHLERQVKHMKK